MAKRLYARSSSDYLQASTWGGVGAGAFFLGVIISIAAGFFAPLRVEVVGILGVLGLVSALVNITAKEVSLYLEAANVFIITSLGLLIMLSLFVPVGELVNAVQAGSVPAVLTGAVTLMATLVHLLAFIVPGAWLIAMKTIIHLGKSR
jgi:hypothetical protein